MSVSAQYLYREGTKLFLMKSDGYDNMDIDVSLVEGGEPAAQQQHRNPRHRDEQHAP